MDSVIEMAQTYEVCKKQLETMLSPSGKSSKNKKHHQSTRPRIECPKCDGQHSPHVTCPAECYRCGKAITLPANVGQTHEKSICS